MTESTRRPKGTGHIFERSTGFYAQWSSRDPATGARKQHKKGPSRTERAARTFLTAQIGKVDAGTFVAPPKPKLLRDVLAAWLATKTEIRATTRESYTVACEKWLVPWLGGTPLPALTEDKIRAALNDLAARGGRSGRPLSARSCQLALVTLRQAINYAIRQGWAVRNPALDVTIKAERAEMSCWTEVEARTFLTAVREDRLYALWALAVTRGPRRGELAGLRWEHVDLDQAFLRIAHTRVLVGGHPQESTPKTKAGQRRIGLDPGLVDILRAHRRRQLEDKLRAGTAWTDSGAVFTDEIGRPLNPDHISDRFGKLCATAGVPTIRLHDTRHTAVTLMIASGEDVKVVSTLAGHADTRITVELYQHVLPGQADGAGARLSKMVL